MFSPQFGMVSISTQHAASLPNKVMKLPLGQIGFLKWEHLAYNSITPPRIEHPPLVLSQLGIY